MKDNNKAVTFIFLSFLCATSIIYIYRIPSWHTTHLGPFEFPSFPLSTLIPMICILFAGIYLGITGRKQSDQALSKFKMTFAIIAAITNAVFLILPTLNLISMFAPRTITGVVDFKADDLAMCITEINKDSRQEINFDDGTDIYEQYGDTDQDRRKSSISEIQLGQVVEIRYIDNDISYWGISPLSITILKGQYKPYNKYESCGDYLESF
jgi:hypothetical protein